MTVIFEHSCTKRERVCVYMMLSMYRECFDVQTSKPRVNSKLFNLAIYPADYLTAVCM